MGTSGHPGHSHSHHVHPAHLSPGGGGGGGRSPAGGPVVGSAQHLGQPLYQEYAHVRSRAHPVPPPVYVTAAPSQAPAAIQQQQVPTYQGFTPGWVPRHLVDACTCVPFITFFILILSFFCCQFHMSLSNTVEIFHSRNPERTFEYYLENKLANIRDQMTYFSILYGSKYYFGNEVSEKVFINPFRTKML